MACQRLMTEIGPKAHAAMRKGFPHNELAAYYYLFAIGTERQHQRRGKCLHPLNEYSV